MTAARPIGRDYTKVVARQEFLSQVDETRIVGVLRLRIDAERRYDEGAIGPEELRSVRNRALEAEARLVAAHLRLVVHVAKRFERDGVDLDDLVGVGNIALVMAARKYPESGRGRFAGYAKGWVRGAVADAADQSGYSVKVPERTARLVRRYVGLVSTQMSNRGRLDRATVRENLGVDDRVLAELERLSFPTVSLSAPVGDGTLTLGDLLFYVDQELLEREETDRQLLLEEVSRLLDGLNEREREVLNLRFGIGGRSVECSRQEVANHFGVGPDKIRDIEVRARSRVLGLARTLGRPELALTARQYSRTANDIAIGAGD